MPELPPQPRVNFRTVPVRGIRVAIRTSSLFGATSLIVLLAAGCASQGERPAEELARARTLIEQAEQGGAQQYAPAELERARTKLAAAESTADKDNERARELAHEAAVDAEYAVARTSAGKAQQSAQTLQQGIESLREEAGRNASGERSQ